jgi:hypothetical protein
MDSHREIVNALASFYELIVTIPCLDAYTIASPPEEGWRIGNGAGKDDRVVELLRCIPYLRQIKRPSTQVLPIYPGVVPICYIDDDEGWRQERDYALPSHCVYLARREDSQGTDLILDAHTGAVTEFAVANELVPYDEYELLPESEKWRAHPTMPLTELLGKWARIYRELSLLVSPNPIGQPVAVRFHVRREEAINADVVYEGGSELDREQKDAARHEWEHAQVRTMPLLVTTFFECLMKRHHHRCYWLILC